MSLLDLDQVTCFYEKSQVLFGVDLSLGEGEVVALMGRNGMGKTTTIRSIFGMLPVFSGEIRFAGSSLSGMASHEIARLGLGLVPEGRRCFSKLTVEENLSAAARKGPWHLGTVGALFPKLQERRMQLAATLSGGEQQMLAIGRALMTNPRLLILDEATEGLSPIVRHEIWSAIAELKWQTGLAIVVVDKSLRELRAIADRAVILQRGASVWSGMMADLTAERAAPLLGV
jgi:branched-chain amino acid transport system ATP-binding protein